MEDTICAVSTAMGLGAISIIRVSGSDCINIVNKIVKKHNINNYSSHTINYCHIIDKDEIIDEVLLTIMRAPKTYTREDVIEINCHGGLPTVNKILELLLINGCRLAEPGEFTKRAFLNGRIDLIEAEGVADLLSSKSEIARKMALGQISGKLSLKIKDLRSKIMELLANIEVNIDYPEYEDALVITNDILIPRLQEILKELKIILKDSQNGLIIKDGINIALIGKPNVGKSSILNKLSEKEKAIVTDIPGTTRDIVESEILIDGIKINLFDTAGIRKTEDKVELIGVNKSKQIIASSDLTILVIDSTEDLDEETLELYDTIKNINYLIFINKTDVGKELKHDFPKEKLIFGNTINNNGLANLINEIKKLYNFGDINNKDVTYLSNARQISIIKNIIGLIEETIKEAKNGVTIDFLSINIKQSWDLLGEIIGETYKDELLDELFSKFCLGK